MVETNGLEVFTAFGFCFLGAPLGFEVCWGLWVLNFFSDRVAFSGVP